MSQSDGSNPPNPSAVNEAGKPVVKKQDRWLAVSVAFVRNGKISNDAKIVYQILDSYTGNDGEYPFPSLETIARQAGISRKSVQRRLKELEQWRMLKREHFKDNGKFQSTRYILCHRRSFLTRGQKGPTRYTEESAKKHYRDSDPDWLTGKGAV